MAETLAVCRGGSLVGRSAVNDSSHFSGRSLIHESRGSPIVDEPLAQLARHHDVRALGASA